MSHSLVQVCTYCGGSAGSGDHEEGCPIATIERMRALIVRYPCPDEACTGTVSVNSADYFECRVCKRQFSRAARDDKNNRAKFTLNTGNDHLPVVVLDERGSGKFLHEDNIRKQQKRMEKIDTHYGEVG